MRRWHAIPVAAIAAVLVGTALISIRQPVVEAGAPGADTLSLDCDTGTAGIQSACTPASGTTSLTIDVVFTNNSGAAGTSAVGFTVRATPQTGFNPPAVASGDGTDGNPAFNDEALPGAWNCTLVATDNDANEGDPAIADSVVGCFIGSGASPALGAGNTVLGTVTYNTVDADGTFTLVAVAIADQDGVPLVECDGNGADVTGTCNDATVNIGAVATSTATATATETNTPVATNTPCAPNCPTNTATVPAATRTSLAYVTVTPTPGGETATAVPGGATTPPPTGPGPAPTAPGGGPGGVIRPPDTGFGDSGGTDWTALSLMILLAIGAGGVAGGTYLVAAGVRARQGRDD